VVFVVTRLSGDPVLLMVEPGTPTADIDAMRTALGLDAPLYEQYLRFLISSLQGDFGTSLWLKQPSMQVVLGRVPATLQLAVAALLFSLVLGLPLGILAALKRRGVRDRIAIGVTVLGQAVPSYVLGLLLILLFAVNMGWFPSSGSGTLRHLVLPMVTLGGFSLARTARLLRSGMLETLSADFVRTARAKGLDERTIVVRHALKATAIPVVTWLGLEAGTLFAGAIITETIFAWPGLGSLVVQAIAQRDFPLVQAIVTVVAVAIVCINLVVDMLYIRLDPRIRFK
jgi:peptide/nickel transport system permease protein